jgi:GTP diphosphokinase / guanosine-3',5'-bis(diphosphate) 3'-diphosphatase
MEKLQVLLEKAILIATKAHAGQVDKGGNPYILHPLAVMQRVKTLKAKIVAVLHDVLEDTTVTKEDLLMEGFPEDIVAAVIGVTRQKGESRKQFIRRASLNPISKEVKIADIEENMDLTRIPNPTEKDYRRIEMYKKELEFLRGII